jgi:hypothetical protein
MTAISAWSPPTPSRPRRPPGHIVAAGLALPAAGALGALVARAPLLAVLGVLVLALGTGIFLRPAVAGYLLIGLTPLVVGIDRGRVIPVIRPNEAVLLVCGCALLARAVWDLRTGAMLRPRLGPVAGLLLLMAVFNSIVPLLWMALRGAPISGDDLIYAIVLWKYLALYAIVRAGIRSAREVERCLWIALTAASIVAVVAVLQSLELFGVPRLLGTFYAPFGDATELSHNRGSSTLALPAATADLMIINLALVAGFWRRYGFRQIALAPVAVLLVVGTLASGQFSAAIGLVVAMVTIGLVSRRSDLPVLFGLVGLAAMWVLRPVIAQRLSGFDQVSGLPESWIGRLHNLRGYFWPTLFSHQNFVLGVQPSARVPGPDSIALPWVWIESGYTWLLWGGGIPLFGTYVMFVFVSVRRSWDVAQRADAFGTAATGALTGVVVVAVLMLFDPHLTYRGSADLLFSLLALTAGAAGSARGAEPDPATGSGTGRTPPPGTAGSIGSRDVPRRHRYEELETGVISSDTGRGGRRR